MASKKKNDGAPGSERPEVFGYTGASRVLGVPVGTIYGWVAQGLIPHVRLGKRLVRFERSVLEAWMDERRVPAAPTGDDR